MVVLNIYLNKQNFHRVIKAMFLLKNIFYIKVEDWDNFLDFHYSITVYNFLTIWNSFCKIIFNVTVKVAPFHIKKCTYTHLICSFQAWSLIFQKNLGKAFYLSYLNFQAWLFSVVCLSKGSIACPWWSWNI